jgi:hypothetical protein
VLCLYFLTAASTIYPQTAGPQQAASLRSGIARRCAVQVGAKLVPVQLQPPNWSIPEEQLRAAFSNKTKFVLVNTPHNPTGKVRQRSAVNG